ncbi:Lcl domain-containing protein [Alcanivorax quisquiliarum]|uniref:DUF1566 domain-containing protein n=1 Tax=Alcanivorax quisquiliarum TaxID=2933565 RepID=A0ABT0E4M3_9GAMM|nr:DUF1566 domain-containing protein [Alcanivorax quisquiliarum]
MKACRFVLLVLCGFSLAIIGVNAANSANSGNHFISDTSGDDLIVLGSDNYTVELSGGDDVVIGGGGDNVYEVHPGSSQITLIETTGSNVVEFQAGITFADVASGLWISGDDLRLVIGSGQQTLTVKDFFAFEETVSSFTFMNGEILSAGQLFAAFGKPAPSTPGNQRVLETEVGAGGLLQGSGASEILLPDSVPATIRGGAGDDLLIGRAEQTIFEFFPGDGANTIIASSGMHIIRFSGGIHFNDVATRLQKSGDDLILGNQNNNDTVRIHQFFSRSNIISAIEFTTGGQLDGESLFQLFGVQAPSVPRSFTINVDGSVWEAGSGAGDEDDDGDGGDGDGDEDGGGEPGDGGGDGDDPNDDLPANPDYLVGTPGNDFIYVGEGNNVVSSGTGDDYIVGGPGDNVYQFASGGGHNTIVESEGYNYILFDQSITYADVSSSFTSQQGSDDLILNISNKNLRLVVRDFFAVADTLSEIRFANGQAIHKDQIFQVFNATPPTVAQGSASLVLGAGDSESIHGSSGADLLIPRMSNRMVFPGSGNDTLIGSHQGLGLASYPPLEGEQAVTFVITPGDGKKTLVAAGGYSDILFAGGIQYADITSQLFREGNDLLLKSAAHGVSVRLAAFFKQPTMLGAIWFEPENEGDPAQSLAGSAIYQLFEQNLPVEPYSLAVLIKGGTTGACHQTSPPSQSQGFGLTPEQLATNNSTPEIISIPPGDAWFDEVLEYQIHANDADNHDLCFSLSAAPDGVQINPDSGRISWVPGWNQLGEQSFVVVVTDERGAVAEQAFILPVLHALLPPEIISTPAISWSAGERFRYTIKLAALSHERDITFNLLAGPAGMQLQDRILSWTPGDGDIGDHAVRLQATDIYGLEYIQEFTLSIAPMVTVDMLAEGLSRVPKTGALSSRFSHDDAATRVGTARVYERDPTNEIVFDKVNGLIWQDSSAVLAPKVFYADAEAYCDTLVHGGITNWRLPNRLELIFLLEHFRDNPDSSERLISSAFEHVGTSSYGADYHAKNNYTRNGGSYLNTLVDFITARVLPTDYDKEGHVRCVSGEQRFVSEFHKPEAAPYVVDRTNRLMWQDNEDVLMQTGNFDQAMNYCDDLQLAGHDDWRLPNFNESHLLQREIEYHVNSRGSSLYFKNIPETPYWQSSTVTSDNTATLYDGTLERRYRFRYQYYTEYWWLENLNFHAIAVDEELPVRCVRSYGEPVPVATVSPLVVAVNELVSLDATDSHHLEADIISYQWRELTEDRVLADSMTAEVSFSTPGVYQIQLAVTDERGLSKTLREPLELTVYGPPLVIIQGPNAVWQGEPVTFDASQSHDAFHDIESFEWTLLNTNEPVGSGAVLALNELDIGVWEFQLEVTNTGGLTTSKIMTVSVAARPDLLVEGHEHNSLGDTVTLNASAPTYAGDIVHYEWRDAHSDTVLGTGSLLELSDLAAGTHGVILLVTDQAGRVHQENISVSVQYPLPVIVLPEEIVAPEGQTVTLDASQSHISHGAIAYFRWFEGDGDVSVGQGPQLQLDSLPLGDRDYWLEAESSEGQVARQAVRVRVGHAPQAVLPEQYFGYVNTLIELDGSASVVAEGGLSFQWRLDGNWLADTAVAQIDGLDPGEYLIELEVSTDLGISDVASLVLMIEPARALTVCPALPVEDDRDYSARYPDDNLEWRGNEAETVEDIERAFNYARSLDPSVSRYLLMPDQASWDAMSVQQKSLYLINAERSARGIKPYAGFDVDIVDAAQTYADYIRTHNMVISHYADGRSPLQRMDAYPDIETHRDLSSFRPESVAGAVATTLPTEDEALVRSIFAWLYQDKDWFSDFEDMEGEPWGHRNHLLQTGLDENHDSPYTEGLLGFGISRGHYAPGQPQNSRYGYVTVLKTLDQGASWDSSRVQTVDISEAQGCNTDHLIELDAALIEQQGLEQITIEPATLLMTPGSLQTLTLTGVYETGQRVDFTSYAQFIPDQRSVVKVEQGEITAIRPGQARVAARLGSLRSNSVHVHVQQPTDTSNLIGTPAQALLQHVPDNATVQSYDPQLMARFTGRAESRQGTPLADVQVSFLNRPDLGSTRTDSTGHFIIAGPAGHQTLVYEKPGHLVVQRNTIAPSNGWGNLATVTLLPRDTARSHIDLTGGQLQVHQSSLITDEFGSRRATVIFNNISKATVVSVDGAQRELEGFWFSATEFETPDSMPGFLPPETAFTFANDLHVEGVHYSDTVLFDGQVVMFIDNFLGFAVGEIIPIGYFDRLVDQWIPSPNGVVVQLIDSDGDGQIDGLDYTGDGLADDLNGNGDTGDEIIGLLAAGYQPGDTLWWGNFDHMTPYDYNLSPSDAEEPVDTETDVDEQQETEEDCVSTGSHCVLHQQSLHETIPVAGTSQALHYHSQRTAGYHHRILVRASGEQIPASLQGIIVRLEIGGHVFEQVLPAIENQEAEFIWDGRNLDGTRTPGLVSGRVSVGYQYQGVFMSTGNAAEEQRALDDFPNAWAQQGERPTLVPGRELVTGWHRSGISVRNSYPSQLAEGWSLSEVHEFDPAGRLYLGSGGVQKVPAQSLILKTGQTYSQINGDDGYYQTGGSVIAYALTEQGTLMDKVTGLEWEYRDRPREFREVSEARSYCAQAVDLPGSGWRLPTSKEAGYTLSKADTNIGPMIYHPTRGRQLWRQRSVNTHNLNLPVLCVRGELLDERNVEALVRDADQGVVIDQDNALMWQDAPVNATLKLNWQDSIAHCESSTYAGYDNWRLPNINELLYALPNEVFQHQTRVTFPPGELWNPTASFRKVYWSSTTNHQDDAQAWGVESESYNSPRFSKNDSYHVRCVREAAEAFRMPFVFDNEGRHLATVDGDSGVTLNTFEYDEAGYLVAIIDRFGRATSIERNASGKPARIIAADGQITTLTLDGDNQLLEVGYEDGGHFLFDYAPAVNGAVSSLLVEKTDPNGHSHERDYDLHGRLLETRNPEQGRWSFYNEHLGVNEDHYGYLTAEHRHYKVERTRLENGDSQWLTRYPDGVEALRTLSPDGLQERLEEQGVITQINHALDKKTLRPRPASILQTLPGGLETSITIEREYAENGADTARYTELTTLNGKVSTLERDTRTGLTRHTTPEGRKLTIQADPLTLLPQQITLDGLLPMFFSYDNAGRLQNLSQGSGTQQRDTALSYDARGNLTSLTDAMGRTTTFGHDLRGRVTTQTFPDGRAVQYSYDANGNLTSLTPPGRSAHLFSYDGIDQVSTYTPPKVPEGHTVTLYHYNRDRDLVRIERPDDREVLFNYNTGGQLVGATLARGTISYQHNPLTGNLTQIITPEGNSLAFQWDGALLTTQSWSGEISGSVSQSPDNNLWISQRCVNSTSCTDFSYDNDGLLTGAGSLSLVRNADHGLVTSATLGILEHSYGYNAFGERISTTISRDGNSFGTLSYSRDKGGRLTARTESLNGSSFTDSYQYDIAGRLTQVTRDGVTTSWQYDDNGNRTHENGQLIASYDAQDRLVSYQGATYQYTANGELASKTESGATTHYTYDELGNLLEVELPGDITIAYVIDGQNRRIGKKVNGSLTHGFLYQDQLNPIAELDGNGNVISHFIYADQPNVPAYMIKDGNTYQIISDHLGSPRLVLDVATGQVAQRLEYDVWGNITQDTNPGFQPFGFAGGIYDQHTQLTRFGARDYDAHSGRWTAKDPIGFAGGDSNMYGYVVNDPVNFLDPEGEAVMIFAGAVIGAAGGLIGTLISNPNASGKEIAASMFAGALTGGFAGAGILGSVLSGAIAGGAGDLIGQVMSLRQEPCESIMDRINWGAVAGSVVGGALSGRIHSAVPNGILGQTVAAPRDFIVTASGAFVGGSIGAK